MGNDHSSHSFDVHDDQEAFTAKMEKIIDVQPARWTSPDVMQGTSKTNLGKDVVESHTTKPERALEMQLAGKTLPNIAQETPKGGFREEKGGQIDKQQNEAIALSLPNEAKEAHVLQVYNEKGDVSPSAPEGVMNVMKEAKLASEINAAHCCTGNTTKMITVEHLHNLTFLENNQCTEQVYELNVGGQSLEHNLQDLSSAQQKPDASRESYTVNKKILSFHLNKEDVPNRNLSKAGAAVLAVSDLEARHPGELAAVTAPESTAKPLPEVTKQLQCCGAGKPSSIKELDKGVSNEPALVIAEAHVSDLDEQGIIQKATQRMHAELETTPVVTQQANAGMEATAQEQALNDSVPDLLESVEKLMNALEEEGKLQVPLVPEKKKLFCCTVL